MTALALAGDLPQCAGVSRPLNPGILYAIGAYGIWGLLPAYLKLLAALPAGDILAWRILFSLALLAVVALLLRHGAALLSILARPRLLGALVASSLLIGVNWLIYIAAVNGGHVADASLGYFINPLLNVVLGVVVLREQLGRGEWAAVLIATAGVVWLTVVMGKLPLTSLALALTFGLYGLVRKLTPVEAIDGLLVETALLGLSAALWLALAGSAGAGQDPGWPLLAVSGVVTAVPLLMFTAAAKRVRYSDLGLLQYLAPTLQLALAVFAYHEPLPPARLAGFALIWLALAVYAVSAARRSRLAPETGEGVQE